MSDMPVATLPALVEAVRRHLWRQRLAIAARAAAWVAVPMLLAVTVLHLVAIPLPWPAVPLVLAATALVALIRVGFQRPDDTACALWADRHLGGASAFSTWLETLRGAQRAADAAALRRLVQWAGERVPAALRALALRRDAPALAAPLATAGTCAALALLALGLPGRAPAPPAPVAATATAPRVADTPAASANTAVPADLVRDVASALRADPPSAEQEPRGGGSDSAPTTEPTRADSAAPDGASSRSVAPAAPPTPAPAPAGGDAAPDHTAPAPPTRGGTPTPGAGREAGDSRDTRADPGVSRGLQGTIPGPRGEPRARAASNPRQADLDQPAAYEEERPMNRTASASPPAPSLAAPAATPPPAGDGATLSPAEARYVQAWRQAGAPGR